MACPYHKTIHEDVLNCDHTLCIYHGHCLSPVDCPEIQSCPLHNLSNQIYKNPETLEKEKIACQQQIAFYKKLIQECQQDNSSQNQGHIQYYNRLISTLEKVLSSFYF